MAKIIGFNKKEMLAILRIMIEINNCYYSLKDGLLQDTAKFFNMPYGLSDAYVMPLSEAQDVLEKKIKNASSERDFVCSIFNYLLKDERFITDEVFRAYYRKAILITNRFINKNDYTIYARNPMDKSEFHLIEVGGANSDSDVRSKVNDKTIGIDSIEKENMRKELLDVVRNELREELKDVVRNELREELYGDVKNLTHKETLYKDL